ncbi:MAG: tight adherence protein, partial [Frankiales bacterium]|nr:tight adherence protein [Frankiales bacterium]
QLDAVAFRTQPATNDPLQQLASATAGTVYQAADVKQLAAAFAHVAHDYDQKLMVAFAVPAGLRDHRVDVALSLPTSAGLLTAHAGLDAPAAETPVASVSPPVPSAGPSASASRSQAAASGLPGAIPPKAAQPQKGSPLTRQSMVTAAVAVGVGLFLLLLLAFDVGSASLGRMRTLRRIARFTLGKLDKPERVVEATTGTGLRHSPLARTAVQVAGRVVERRDPEQKLRLLLDRAGIPLLPSEWLLVLGGSAALGTVLVSVASRSAWVGLLAGGVVGGAVPHVIARVKARRRMDAFLAALPDALQMTAGSLATGYSLPQALDAIVRQGGDPMATEVGRALAQARLGIPLEDALQELAERMQCRDFEWVVMAIRINRDVGGSLSDVLSTVARTLREREQLRRHVRGLSAEGRLSAYILVGLPLVVAGFLFSFRRAYIRPLYTEPAGIVMLAGAVTLVLIGAVWMRSLVKVEV